MFRSGQTTNSKTRKLHEDLEMTEHGEETRLCTKCEKDRAVSLFVSQRNPVNPATKRCMFCRNRNKISERKRLQEIKVRNIRLEQTSVDTATPPTTRWCSQCKRENPISEYTSTDARRHGLMKSCRCCRKAQARSKRRQKGDNEYEYDTEHDGRPKELENDTERTDIVQGCSPQEHDNGQMTLCSDCNQETSVGGALEKSSRE
jgi:CRISPR/Cas system-associated protein Cas10 (large subunit of type III CRISPR-Cas system)